MLRRKLSSFCANINYPRRSKIVHFKACRDKLKSYNVETLIDSKGIRHIVALMFDCKSMHFFSLQYLLCVIFISLLNIFLAISGIFFISSIRGSLLCGIRIHLTVKDEQLIFFIVFEIEVHFAVVSS